jgi:hypothetical protein
MNSYLEATAVANCERRQVSRTISAKPMKFQWNQALPIFAKPEFLMAVGGECGWLGGTDEFGTLRCFLPYTIIRKAGLRLVRFRMATIPLGGGLDLSEERAFLNSAVQHFRTTGADLIVPASNNSVFRAYPEGAVAAPYGSYVIDLRQPEDVLWTNIGRKTRQNISTAQKSGVTIREGMEFLEPAYDLIRETFRRSKLPFMGRFAFERFVRGLGENGKLLMAEHQGVVQSYCLFAFSTPCVYAVYGGNIEHQCPGANKLLYWDAILLFRELGVEKFDFFGARINPQKGSKQEGINLLKKLMGGKLAEGYNWKYSLRPWRAWVYSIGVRVLSGGDNVDHEAHKLKDYAPNLDAEAAPFSQDEYGS